jgi:hypothetical protein
MERVGFRRATMGNDIIRATGRETAAELNTITTGIGIETAAITIDMTIDMVITIITGTTDNPAVAGTENPLKCDQVSGSWRRAGS